MINELGRTKICVVHVFPYCHKVSGGHSNAIRAFMQSESEVGIDSRMICPACDPGRPEETITTERILARKIVSNSTGEEEQMAELPANSKNLLFHLHGVDPHSTRCGKILIRLSIPYVFTSHGTLYCRNAMQFLKKFVYLNFMSPLVKNASGIHFLTNKMVRQLPVLMPFWSGEVVTAPNAVILPDSNQVGAAGRNRFRIPEDAFLFLYMGRLDVHTKGLDILVQAFARLAVDAKAWLALVGPDWENGQERLTQLVAPLKCADRVSFLGPQYGDNKWKVLKMADAFVSPSRWEAFSISLVEAMGLGLPTITSTKTNIAADLRRARAAVLSDVSVGSLAAAMQQIVNAPQLRKEIVVRGHAWVLQNCSTRRVGKLLADFYRRVLRSRYE